MSKGDSLFERTSLRFASAARILVTRSPLFCVLGLAILSLGGCAGTRAAQTALARRLAVEAVLSGPLVAGRANAVRVVVMNRSRNRVSACFTPGMRCSVTLNSGQGVPPKQASSPLEIVDHPGCIAPIELARGGVVELKVAIEIPADFVSLHGNLGCGVVVSTGRHCDRVYGCFAAGLSSPGVDVLVSPAGSE